VNRILVIVEASGLSSDFGSYIMRSLLSEGCIRYLTTEKTSEGMKSRLIEREGPTGLIVTTTLPTLHPENETRLLSITVNDSQDQTKAILKSLAEQNKMNPPDLTRWVNLQLWLDHAEHRTVIPYAEKIG